MKKNIVFMALLAGSTAIGIAQDVQEVAYPKNSNIVRNEYPEYKAGYKGFVDFGYTLGVGDYGEDRIALATSHGYQFNPYLYAGAGVGLNFYHDSESFVLPIFAHIRANAFKGAISPYVDFRIGYSILDAKGFYMSPSIGCKLNPFNLSIGYEIQKTKVYGEGGSNCNGISFRIGFEF